MKTPTFNKSLAGFVLAIFLCVFLAWPSVDVSAQLWLAFALLTGILFCFRAPQNKTAHFVMMGLATFLTLRYLAWRIMHTMVFDSFVGLIMGTLLFAAEIYAIAVYLLGIFVNINPLWRKPVPVDLGSKDLPSVDVLIPSYNEGWATLSKTLLAAIQINYPKDKLKIYLLDDGGTSQKRNLPDKKEALEAEARHSFLKKKCDEIGVFYLTREQNLHAKAGNINEGLKASQGELVVILDADHIPTTDFLEKTVGPFLEDPLLFLVQTPHFFVNADPIEKNLHTFSTMPGENTMFYRGIQNGLDFWNSAFFCGSAAVLRRAHIEKVGGLSGKTLTEDAETSLKLHAAGFNSIYLRRPMIAGLQPESLSSFITQRARWAMGMVQLFLENNPLKTKGLHWYQKIAYLNNMLFWFFPLFRLVFIVVPSAFLIFKLHIYNASLREVLAYTVPHIMAAFVVFVRLYGKYRWNLMSEIYEIILSVYLLPSVLSVFGKNKNKTFKVTPKGEDLSHGQLSPLATPFFLIIILIFVSLAMGLVHYQANPLLIEAFAINTVWEIFNLILILCVLGVLYEEQQRRLEPRIVLKNKAVLFSEKKNWKATLHDVSASGISVILENRIRFDPLTSYFIEIQNKNKTCRFRVKLVRSFELTPNQTQAAFTFEPTSTEIEAEKIALIYGSSELWEQWMQQKENNSSWHEILFYLPAMGLKYFYLHAWLVIHTVLNAFNLKKQSLKEKLS
ncbi:MAG: cellulose synthase catalytic subunit (UDP-forming) [Deltaproteobacteria bacterium GWA2_45_12]|nr:MAG: cellulose synthase catalytic subunit (UDP-forming) [Deltaproteobacteria bacterium GWA2_45_12]